jgi:hypothetical protein
MQVDVETLTRREKRRDLGSAGFDQKQSLDDARCQCWLPQHGDLRRSLRCAGYASLPLPRVWQPG